MDTGSDWNDEELIDRYLNDECAGDELRLFVQRYQTDAAFAEKTDAARAILEAGRDMRYEDRVREMVKQISREKDTRAVVIRRFSWGTSGVMAAAVAFIIFLAYAPLDIPVQTQEIRVARNFKDTIEQDSVENGKKKIFGSFFEAQSYLAEGEFQPAILKLEELAEIKELRPYFKEAVQWHLVLAHLKNGNPERAQLLYNNLKEPTEYNISRIDRWKVWWQIQKRKWLG